MTSFVAPDPLPAWLDSIPGWAAVLLGVVLASMASVFVITFPRWLAARKSRSDWTTPGKWGTW